MNTYVGYKCTVTPEDVLKVETSFDDRYSIGFEAKLANGVETIICLDVDQTKLLIKQLQKAVKDTGQ